jgi:glucose-6-phosphate 1-epimerase
VYLHGAQVTSWIPAGDRDDRLYLSSRATFRDGAPIRGGIPVSFPQFAKQGPLPNHGFARTSAWELVQSELEDDGGASARFRLRDSAETRAIWSHAFELSLAVRVTGPTLAVELAVANTGTTGFSFTAALHTYLSVESAAETVVRGLSGAVYRDKLADVARALDGASELRIDRAHDRVYVAAPRDLELVERDRRTAIRATGFPDAVVWNPGPAAAKFADLAPGDESRFVCVEAAAAAESVTLIPGGRWLGSQMLAARSAPSPRS